MQNWETVLLIVNPQSGGGKGKKWAPHLEAELRRRGLCVQTVMTERTGSAAEAVQRYPADLVLVAGGDGVFHDAINGWHRTGRRAPVALIPIGTGNVFASNMNLSFHPLEALERTLNGQVRWLDLGEADGRVFHCNIGIGFDAYVVAKVETVGQSPKRLLGELFYILEALRHSVRYHWSHIRIEMELADGKGEVWEKDAWLVLISNMPYYGGGIKVTPVAKPDDGLLDLCMFPSQSKMDYFRFAVLGLLGWHLRHPEVVVRQIRSVHIVSEPPVPTQMDGEPAPITPVTVRVLPQALPVLLPK